MHLDPFVPLVLVALGGVGFLLVRRMVRNFDKRFGHDNSRRSPTE